MYTQLTVIKIFHEETNCLASKLKNNPSDNKVSIKIWEFYILLIKQEIII